MILEKGNMWDIFGKTDLFLITTNPVIRKDGALVMGRGIAKEAADRFPLLPYKFGRHVYALLDAEMMSYTDGVDFFDDQLMGFFMVKYHWNNPANLEVITRSTKELQSWLIDDPFNRVDLNFPGIGNGKLKREDVLPIIQVLPDNVHVWEYSE